MINNPSTKRDEYIKRFHDPKFTAYDFLSLFCAVYASQKEYSFDRNNLINFMNFCKQNSIFENLLDDIHFKNNGIRHYSEEFNEAISKLRWGGILYTVSPEQNSIIFIFNNIPISGLMNSRTNYITEMNDFIDQYRNFKINDDKAQNNFVLKKITQNNK